MSNRLCVATLVTVLVLATGGCGAGSSTHPTAIASTTQTSSPTQPIAPSSTTTPAKLPHSTASHPTSTPRTSSSSRTRSSTATTSTHATATTAATVRTTPPPTPSGTPPAPAGLTQSTGYGTYELCASGCSGSVPTALRRALRLPHIASGAPCPASRGNGPVKPLGSAPLALTPFIGSAWRGGRVTWTSARSYTGPVLIRGAELGGPGALGFGEGRVPYDELQLLASGMGAGSPPGGGREWLSFTRVRSPGCYGYQVDGTSFSTVIVFRAGH